MKICILDICPENITENHATVLNNGEYDYYFVTYKGQNDKAISFNKGKSWGYNRNFLFEHVKGKYDYYVFIDYDIILEHKNGLNPIDYIVTILEKYKPLLYRPAGFNTDLKLSEGFAVGGFINHSITVMHDSIAQAIFPLSTNYGGFWDTASYLNTITIPIIENNVLVDYNIIAHNTQSSNYIQNVIPTIGKSAMQKIYATTCKYYTTNVPAIKKIGDFRTYWQDRIKIGEPTPLSETPTFDMNHYLDIEGLKKELKIIP